MNRFVTLGAAVVLQIGVMKPQAEVDHTTFVGYAKPSSGGGSVTVSSAGELISAAQSSGGRTIKINGSISNALIVCSSNKHFIGVGTGAKLTQSSFLIKDASDIIIQNITMNYPYPGEVKGSDHDNDVIHIEGSSSRIWIDHCELYNNYDDVKKDDYDGLIDLKKGCRQVTISWNYIHDAWKTSLIGYSDKDNSSDWQISMHHNLFNNVHSRVPSIRGGVASVFNNYYLLIPETAINSRQGAKVYCEKNYFDGVGSGKEEDLGYDEGPIGTYYSDNIGFWNSVDNYYVNCKGNQPTNSESTTDYKPSFMDGKTVIPVADVPEAIKEFAGIIGKTKKLKYPEPTRTIRTPQIVTKNRRATSSATYTILGMKILSGRASPANAVHGVSITKENGKSIVRLNVAH
ncbi:MAG: hypothetical protein JW863_15900 [Chitinispirillaceae bacterium]|nr:hypothetical protein [Chitinispirillaceae bacterium]